MHIKKYLVGSHKGKQENREKGTKTKIQVGQIE